MTEEIKPHRGKQNLKMWKKGQSGNPKGSMKVPIEIVEARKLTKIQFEDKLQKFLHMPMEQMQTIMQQPDSNTIDVLVGSIITRAILEGCIQRTNFLLQRMGITADNGKIFDVADDANAPAQVDSGSVFIVEVNDGGKFMRSRPRELLTEEIKTVNG